LICRHPDPYNPRLGGRVSLYDWNADKKPGPKHSITIHLRRLVQKGQEKMHENKGEIGSVRATKKG
jgi:hypothetical protein